MIKVDERTFLQAVLDRGVVWGVRDEGDSVRDIGTSLAIHPNRMAYICQKWADADFYDYGVSCTLGWITDEAAARRRLNT